MERILVIDDDVELCHLVGEYLRAEGFTTECVHDGETGLKKATAGEYLLAVLDVMLPGINGFEVLRRIRATSRLPVLLLTARGEDVDRIVGLEIGADDSCPSRLIRVSWWRAFVPYCGARVATKPCLQPPISFASARLSSIQPLASFAGMGSRSI